MYTRGWLHVCGNAHMRNLGVQSCMHKGVCVGMYAWASTDKGVCVCISAMLIMTMCSLYLHAQCVHSSSSGG